MAFTPRTTQQVYDSLIAEKNANVDLVSLQPNIDDAQTLLNDLSTNTKVAEWRLWVWLVAFGISTLEKLWGLFQTEISDTVNQSHFGTLPWYRKMSLEYQHGDPLVFLNNKWQYATIDLTLRIIKKAAATENPGVVFVKVAKENGVPLDLTEKAAFTAFIDSIAPPGINTTVISQDPDDLKFDISIYYDPLVMAADGSLLSDAGVFPVEDAILGYIGSIDFDGKLMITKLQDAMQVAEGVVDPIVNGVETRYGVNPYAAVVISAHSFSGHFRKDPALAWSTQITYIANA